MSLQVPVIAMIVLPLVLVPALQERVDLSACNFAFLSESESSVLALCAAQLPVPSVVLVSHATKLSNVVFCLLELPVNHPTLILVPLCYRGAHT